MKDLAYFVGSCFRDEEAEEMEVEVLNYYFTQFRKSLARINSQVTGEEVERTGVLYTVSLGLTFIVL